MHGSSLPNHPDSIYSTSKPPGYVELVSCCEIICHLMIFSSGPSLVQKSVGLICCAPNWRPSAPHYFYCFSCYFSGQRCC